MPRQAKAALLALVVCGLLLLVAFAARGGHPNGSGRVSQRAVPYALQDSLLTLIAVLYGIAIVVAIVLMFRHREKWREPESHWLRNLIAILVVMATVALVYALVARKPTPQQGERVHIGRLQERGEPLARPQNLPPRHAKFDWPLALSVVALIVIGGAVVFIRMRRPGPIAPVAETVEQELASAVETTIDDLQSEGDPRRAVIAAYASMERVLASHGLARRRSDAPLEYLARVLRRLNVRESAVRSLTELFEYAKFSQHEIGADMKEEAITALEHLRDDLRREEMLAA